MSSVEGNQNQPFLAFPFRRFGFEYQNVRRLAHKEVLFKEFDWMVVPK